jgi:RES domain-containing protein
LAVAWRIVKARYGAVAFDGEGARLHGGRWNSPGVPLVYTSESPALAALELLLGLSDSTALGGFVLLSVEIPDGAIVDLETARLPPSWKSFPAPPELAQLGDTWAKTRASLALRVPTVVVPYQSNILLNPLHDDFSSLRFGEPEPFAFDERLLER